MDFLHTFTSILPLVTQTLDNSNTKTPWKHKLCYAIDMWLTYYSFFMEAVVDCYTSTVKQLPKYYNVNRNGSTDQQSQGPISTYKFSKLIFINFLTELVVRICSKIEAFLLGYHYIYSHKLFLLTMYWYCWEKVDVGQSLLGIKG